MSWEALWSNLDNVTVLSRVKEAFKGHSVIWLCDYPQNSHKDSAILILMLIQKIIGGQRDPKTRFPGSSLAWILLSQQNWAPQKQRPLVSHSSTTHPAPEIIVGTHIQIFNIDLLFNVHVLPMYNSSSRCPGFLRRVYGEFEAARQWYHQVGSHLDCLGVKGEEMVKKHQYARHDSGSSADIICSFLTTTLWTRR